MDFNFIYFLNFLLNYFTFFIFRTLGLGLEVISQLVTPDGVVIILIMGYKRKE